MKTAIIIVDVQNDFVDGGALAVKGGKAIIPHIAKVVDEMKGRALIITTQDWHPVDHSQFSPNPDYKTTWPVHCVQGSAGAHLVQELLDILPKDTIHAFKGEDKNEDGYSAFESYIFIDGPGDTPLDEVLKTDGITHLYVCGIATDYCVQATVADALLHGYRVTLLTDCIAGVAENTSDEAISLMAQAGVQFMSTPQPDTDSKT